MHTPLYSDTSYGKYTLYIDTLILPALILKIVSFHDFPQKSCLGRPFAAWPVQASFGEKIMEGDNFQNYGGKYQCSIYVMWGNILT